MNRQLGSGLVVGAAASVLLAIKLLAPERVDLRTSENCAPVHPFFTKGTIPRPFLEAELRRLIAVGLIDRVTGKGFRTMGDSGDVGETFHITADGRRYLDILESISPASSESDGDGELSALPSG